MMLRNKSIKLISEDQNNSEKIERKQIENICEACTKVIQQCSKKELKVLDLKWQPHYSTVFKQLKFQLEAILSNDTSKSLDKLNTIPYLLSLKNNIFSLLNSFSKFVLENGGSIGTKDHNHRRSFFVKVVHFQFLCHEIQAFFPGGNYSPSKVKISKLPARAWWEKMFGEVTFVDLDTFVNKFKEDYPFINQAEIFSFKNSINFTSTNFTTTFEFDLFTRLYSPWEMIHEAWRIIYNHPAYLHFSTYGDTKDILSRYLDRPGTYVFRVSCKDLGFWTIGYVKSSKDMGQIKVDKTNLIEALVEGQKKNMYLYPNGEFTNPDLSNLNEYRKEIVVKNEDLQLYDCFEDYKECKICREAEKDLQLESCGHQICQGCFKMMRKYDKKLCPFCNQKVQSTTKVVNIKNQCVYVGPNPAQTENDNIPNDGTYADMSSVNKEDSEPIDEDRSVYVRVNMTPTTENSRYSNDSYEFPVNELSTSASFSAFVATAYETVPDTPPRPLRNRAIDVTTEFKKSEINYPPMSKNKSEGFTNETSFPTNVNRQPFSVCTTNPVIVKVDDMYSDMAESELHETPLLQTATKKPVTNVSNIPRYGNASSLPLDSLDDVYCDPRDDCHNNVNHTTTHNTSVVDHSIDEPDDIYSDPIDNPNGKNEPYAFSKESNATRMQPVVNSNNNSSITVSKDTPPSTSTNNGYINADDTSDDIYAYPGDDIDDLSALWSARDVARALRVAGNNRTLAREILIEFVGIN